MPNPTWPSVAARLHQLLPIWDHYCPDDGRPAAALLAAAQYYRQPSPAYYAGLVERTPAAYAAYDMAWGTWEADEGRSAAYYAAQVGSAVWCLGQQLRLGPADVVDWMREVVNSMELAEPALAS